MTEVEATTSTEPAAAATPDAPDAPDALDASAPVDGGPLPWREIVQFALLGVLGLLVLVLVDVSRYGGSNPVSLIQPGTLGPSTRLIAEDFPDIEQPESTGLDGQQYYAIAANPTDLDGAAEHLDWPRYRWQRPLLPWTAALVSGGSSGLPLVWALFAVGTAAALGGALASGALSTMWRGPAWVAGVFPLLPGAYWSLRVTVSDAMALALALGAVALAARSRHLPAIALGVLAVLAKEPAILILAGWALHRRTRRDALVAVVPAGVVVAWMAVLAASLPPDPDRAQDIAAPFVGLVQAFTDVWSHGNELVGMACTLGGLALGIAALVVRRLRHPLGWAIAIQLAFVLVMGVNPTSVNFGATRMAMPVMMLSIIALATPDAGREDRASS